MSIRILMSLFCLAYAAKNACPEDGIIAPRQHTLDTVRTGFLNISHDFGYPVGITYAKQKNVAFVSLGANDTKHTGVLALDTSTFVPTVIRHIPLPFPSTPGEQAAFEITLSPTGQFLYVAFGKGAFVINTAHAIQKTRNPIVGYLDGGIGKRHTGKVAFGIAATEDYVFVLQENREFGQRLIGDVDVFRLDHPQRAGNVTGSVVGFVNLGESVTDGVFSPNHDLLYVVSEVAPTRHQVNGSISILDVSTLKKNPKESVLGSVIADCQPTRALVSKDGKIIWVANRNSNTVLALNAALALSDPKHARIASVDVGTAPDGLVLVKDETRLLVANTNRFHDIHTSSFKPRAKAGISVINVSAALSQDPGANIGQIPSGLFPRDFALSPDKQTVLLTNYGSQQVMAIDVSTVP